MVVINPIDGAAAAKDQPPQLPHTVTGEPEVLPPEYYQYSNAHPIPSGSTTYPPIPQPLPIPPPPLPPKAPTDLSYTRPIEYSLRCLYTTLAVSIFMFIIEMTPWCQPMFSLWFFPTGYLLTVTFSSAVIMVTFRDRARFQRKNWSSMHPVTPPLPAVCKKEVIVPCFLLVTYWMVTDALVLWLKITGRVWNIVGSLTRHTYLPPNDDTYSVVLILGLVEAVCVAGQVGLLLAVGIMGAMERKKAKRALKALEEERGTP